MAQQQTPARVRKAHSLAQLEFAHYHSAYRRAAREQGIAPTGRFEWLTSPAKRNELERKFGHVTGAALLAWSGHRPPVDAHDAALRVLASYAPGLRLDCLVVRAELARIMAACGRPVPYIRCAH